MAISLLDVLDLGISPLVMFSEVGTPRRRSTESIGKTCWAERYDEKGDVKRLQLRSTSR
jgi:hypothetical protein